MRVRRSSIALLGLMALSAASLLPGGCNKTAQPELYNVSIGQHTWKVELARTEAEQKRGLAGAERIDMPADRGMLFIFDKPAVHEFWMWGCEIDLDVAFIDAERRIVKIHTMACQPVQTRDKTYSSEKPVLYALEVRGGELAKAGVRVNDVVEFDSRIPLPTAK